MPDDHADAIHAALAESAASEIARQLYYAELDTRMHSGRQTKSLTILAQEVAQRHGLKGPGEFARMSHHVGYGASYYSYLYSSVHAATIWRRVFAPSPLDSVPGRQLEEILSGGGTVEPSEVLERLTGSRNLDIDSLFDGHTINLRHV